MKSIDRVLIVVFCVFIFAFGIVFLVMPRENFSAVSYTHLDVYKRQV